MVERAMSPLKSGKIIFHAISCKTDKNNYITKKCIEMFLWCQNVIIMCKIITILVGNLNNNSIKNASRMMKGYPVES